MLIFFLDTENSSLFSIFNSHHRLLSSLLPAA
jgi:hypothetical protein